MACKAVPNVRVELFLRRCAPSRRPQRPADGWPRCELEWNCGIFTRPSLPLTCAADWDGSHSM